MKNKTWILLIIVLGLIFTAVFLKDDIRRLFLPEGGPADRPVENVNSSR